MNPDDTDMKIVSVTKLDKNNKTKSKKLTVMPCQEIVISLSFFQFMVNLEQSGSRIPEVQSVKRSYSLIVTFCLIQTENRTKKYITQLSHYCFE